MNQQDTQINKNSPDVNPQLITENGGSKNKTFYIIIGGIVILIFLFSIAAFFLGKYNAKTSSSELLAETNQRANVQITIAPTNNPSPKPDLDFESIGIKIEIPSSWSSTETSNNTVELEQKDLGRKITIIKNYLGGAAGFKEYKPTEETTLNNVSIKKIFLTEDSDKPETVSMFINIKNEEDKYLIIGNWKIDDLKGENEINQILETLEFK